MIDIKIPASYLKMVTRDIEKILKGVEYKAVRIVIKDNILHFITGQYAHYKATYELDGEVEDIDVCFLYKTPIASYLGNSKGEARLILTQGNIKIITEDISIVLVSSLEAVVDFSTDSAKEIDFDIKSFISSVSLLTNLKKYEKAYGKKLPLICTDSFIQTSNPVICCQITLPFFNAVFNSKCAEILLYFLKTHDGVVTKCTKTSATFKSKNATLVIPFLDCSEIKDISNFVNNSEYILTTNMSECSLVYSEMLKAVGSTEASLTIFEDGLSVSIQTDSISCCRKIGDCSSENSIILNYRLELFEDILKIFNDHTEVKVYTKGDLICFQSGAITVLISCQN